MTDFAPIETACRNLDLQFVDTPEARNKFLTAPVANPTSNKRFFLKAVQNTQRFAWEDLENECIWNTENRDYLASCGYQVPEVVARDPYSQWALFEYLEGSPLDEADVRAHIADLALLGTTICLLPLGRPVIAPLDMWFKRRIRNNMDIPERFLSQQNHRKLDALGRGIISVAGIILPGTVHGDFKPGNILRSNRGELSVVDSEFGTVTAPHQDTRVRRRTEHDKPRYHDLAYMYHLLWCQYQDPVLAREFAKAAYANLSRERGISPTDFNQEFGLSVLERTLSMAKHFVFSRDETKKVDDIRRTEPEPYKDLIAFTLANVA